MGAGNKEYHGHKTVRATARKSDVYRQPTKEAQIELLDKCLKKLESADLPTGPVVDTWTPHHPGKISNLRAFIDSHAALVRANAGIKRLAGPYLRRLYYTAEHFAAALTLVFVLVFAADQYPPAERPGAVLAQNEGLKNYYTWFVSGAVSPIGRSRLYEIDYGF